MPKIFNDENLNYKSNNCKIPEYIWQSGSTISKSISSDNLKFNVRVLEPGKYSYPYHSHRNAEELFVILEGEGTIRTPEGFNQVKKGDLVFFEKGATGAHQLKNTGTKPLKYVDIQTFLGLDVCDYPDSDKTNILPECDIFENDTKVEYFKGEGIGSNRLSDIWKDN